MVAPCPADNFYFLVCVGAYSSATVMQQTSIGLHDTRIALSSQCDYAGSVEISLIAVLNYTKVGKKFSACERSYLELYLHRFAT